jgi:hypothetical protein
MAPEAAAGRKDPHLEPSTVVLRLTLDLGLQDMDRMNVILFSHTVCSYL